MGQALGYCFWHLGYVVKDFCPREVHSLSAHFCAFRTDEVRCVTPSGNMGKENIILSALLKKIISFSPVRFNTLH